MTDEEYVAMLRAIPWGERTEDDQAEIRRVLRLHPDLKA
jgi:hypothetical protein